MNNAMITSTQNDLNLGHIGWKYYNNIKKKAMDKEFSWSGLLISLSVAFFIVISCACLLQFIYSSIDETNFLLFGNNNIYQLENMNGNTENYIHLDLLSEERQQIVKSYNLA